MPLSGRTDWPYCTHRRTERCLCIGDIWYRICRECGAVEPDGPRQMRYERGDGPVHVNTIGLTDPLLLDLED